MGLQGFVGGVRKKEKNGDRRRRKLGGIRRAHTGKRGGGRSRLGKKTRKGISSTDNWRTV